MYYDQANWSKNDDQQVKTLHEALHELAVNWHCFSADLPTVAELAQRAE